MSTSEIFSRKKHRIRITFSLCIIGKLIAEFNLLFTARSALKKFYHYKDHFIKVIFFVAKLVLSNPIPFENLKKMN